MPPIDGEVHGRANYELAKRYLCQRANTIPRIVYSNFIGKLSRQTMKEMPFSKDEIAQELQRLQNKIQQTEETLKEATEMLKRLRDLEHSRARENDIRIEDTTNVQNSAYRSAALAQLEFVRSYAKEKGYTDQYLADKMGLSRANVTRMFSGNHIPRLDTFMMLCEAVGLPTIDIARTAK